MLSRAAALARSTRPLLTRGSDELLCIAAVAPCKPWTVLLFVAVAIACDARLLLVLAELATLCRRDALDLFGLSAGSLVTALRTTVEGVSGSGRPVLIGV